MQQEVEMIWMLIQEMVVAHSVVVTEELVERPQELLGD